MTSLAFLFEVALEGQLKYPTFLRHHWIPFYLSEIRIMLCKEVDLEKFAKIVFISLHKIMIDF